MHNEIKALAENEKSRAWYDDESDQFCFILEGTDGEIASYAATARIVDGRVLKLYPVGWWYWTWEEHREREETF